MKQKTRNIIGWILTGLLALMFIGSGIMKLSGSEEVIKGAAMFGISEDTLKCIGALELLSILLFIIPRTGALGTLLLVALMGGAIATHLQHHMPFMMPVILQCLIWITALIRFPELGTRLMGKTSSEPVG